MACRLPFCLPLRGDYDYLPALMFNKNSITKELEFAFMQVKETSSKGLAREYSITLEAEAVEQKLQARLQEVGRNAKIPGFRPGKIPNNILKQRYGQQIMGEVIERAVNDSSQEVIKEKELRLASQPKIEITNFDEGKPLEFSMKVELFPEMPEVDFEKFKLDRYIFDVDEKDIDEGLGRLAEANPQPKKIAKARACKEGDVVLIDFLGKVDGTPFDGGKAEGFSLELGSGQFIPGFEDQVIGMKPAEEKVITVKFPENYHSEELKGKEATFDITLHEVQEKVTPEVNEEFAQNLGFKDLAMLRDKVKEQLESDFGGFIRNNLKKQLFDLLDDKVEAELPESLMEQEFKSIWDKIEKAKKEGDEELKGKSEKALKEEYTKVAERRVKLGLFLADVSSKNGLSVSQEEFNRAIMDQAKMFPGQEQQIIQYYQQNPQHIYELQGPLLEEKAVDFVLAKVKFNDQKKTLEELLELDRKEREEESKPKAKKSTTKKASAEKSDGEKSDKKPAAKKTTAKKKEAK
jgi:trigger factor